MGDPGGRGGWGLERKVHEVVDFVRVLGLLVISLLLFSCSVMSDSLQPHGLTCQVPLSMELSRQEYWGGLPFSPPRDLPNPGIELVSPEYPALAGGFFTTEPPGKPHTLYIQCTYIHIHYVICIFITYS